MKRREFLRLAGLTALAACYEPTKEQVLAVPDAPIRLSYRSTPGGMFIEVEYEQDHVDISKLTEDIGTLNPGDVVIDGRTYKRGELLYQGAMAVKVGTYFQTTYTFNCRPGGHNPMIFSPLTGLPGTIELREYAKNKIC